MENKNNDDNPEFKKPKRTRIIKKRDLTPETIAKLTRVYGNAAKGSKQCLICAVNVTEKITDNSIQDFEEVREHIMSKHRSKQTTDTESSASETEDSSAKVRLNNTLTTDLNKTLNFTSEYENPNINNDVINPQQATPTTIDDSQNFQNFQTATQTFQTFSTPTITTTTVTTTSITTPITSHSTNIITNNTNTTNNTLKNIKDLITDYHTSQTTITSPNTPDNDNDYETPDDNSPFTLATQNKRKRQSPNLTKGKFKLTKTTDLSQIVSQRISTKNRYQPLDTEPDTDITYTTDDEQMQTDTTDNLPSTSYKTQKIISQRAREYSKKLHQTTNNTNDNNKKDKKIIPPPIIIEGVANTKQQYTKLIDSIKIILKKGNFKVKFAKKTTIIQFDNIDDYNSYLRTLQGNPNNNYHTYATDETKTHAFVVRGLDHRPDTDDVKQSLNNDYNLPVKQVYEMKSTFRPLYMIVFTGNDVTLKYLQTNVKYIQHLSVTWETRQNKTTIIQCKRCQAWGHAATFCFRQQKCLRCGENHPTNECKVTEENFKCVNCGGPHIANSNMCPVYTFKVGKIVENRENRQNFRQKQQQQ